jgi:hypothetical protein
MTGTASRTARALPRGGVRRKLYAKLRPDEQEAHRGDGTRARGHENLKPKVIRRVPAYMRRVDGRKVARLTLGDLPFCRKARTAAWRAEGAAEVKRLKDRLRALFRSGRGRNLGRLIEKGYGGDPYAMTADYFRRYADFVLNYHPDIIAHFDLVRKFNQRFDFFNEGDPRYYGPALDALARMAETDALLELNTGAISRGWRTDPYPSPRLLTRWRELGGRTIIGGDCHDAAFIDCSFNLCVQMLLDAGFSEVWRLGTGDELFEPVPLS